MRALAIRRGLVTFAILGCPTLLASELAQAARAAWPDPPQFPRAHAREARESTVAAPPQEGQQLGVKGNSDQLFGFAFLKLRG
jgi:hypothetical protein